jgi:hypothetical protein
MDAPTDVRGIALCHLANARQLLEKAIQEIPVIEIVDPQCNDFTNLLR